MGFRRSDREGIQVPGQLGGRSGRPYDPDDPLGSGHPGEYVEPGPELVEIGQWSRIESTILRARLESAGINVLVEWTSARADALGTILVPATHEAFATAVVTELDVDDEVPDRSPEAFIMRIEEHLGAIGSLLEELRARVDQVDR